jgi:hypothetical protein
MLMETVLSQTTLGVAKEMNAFRFNTLESKEAVAAIFGTEAATLHSRLLTQGCGKPTPNQVKQDMVWAMVDCSVPTKWQVHFAYLLDDYFDIISEGKTNLGHSDTVIHDIELMD